MFLWAIERGVGTMRNGVLIAAKMGQKRNSGGCQSEKVWIRGNACGEENKELNGKRIAQLI